MIHEDIGDDWIFSNSETSLNVVDLMIKTIQVKYKKMLFFSYSKSILLLFLGKNLSTELQELTLLINYRENTLGPLHLQT